MGELLARDLEQKATSVRERLAAAVREHGRVVYEVLDRLQRRYMPYNRVHDRQFPSIGCSPCTRATQPGESRRAGRWWWEQPESRECGLHPRIRQAAAQA